MADTIEPALTPEQWESLRNGDLGIMSLEGVAAVLSDPHHLDDGPGAARIIAAMNHRLPDSDLRKITRETVRLMRDVAHGLRIRIDDTTPESYHAPLHGDVNLLLAAADALESYLPLESSTDQQPGGVWFDKA